MRTRGAPTEIGILAYSDCQPAAIHGLIDLFTEASRISREMGSAAAQVLRVTHWRIVLDGSPMQQVAVLALPDGELMTESAPSFCGA